MVHIPAQRGGDGARGKCDGAENGKSLQIGCNAGVQIVGWRINIAGATYRVKAVSQSAGSVTHDRRCSTRWRWL